MKSDFQEKDYSFTSPFLIKPPLLTEKISSYNKLNISTTKSFELVNNNSNDNTSYKIFSDKCINCYQPIERVKFLCCICENYNLCSLCEKYHEHPTLKIKNADLSSINEIINFISVHQNENTNNINTNQKHPQNIKKLISGLFESTPKIHIVISIENEIFTIRPCRKLNITVGIENKSKSIIPPNILRFIFKNFGNLGTTNTLIESEINALEKIEYEIEIEANLQRKVYVVDLSLLCVDESIKIECNTLNFDIEVNDDVEEEELNEYFKKYPKVKQCSKDKKNLIKYLMEEKIAKCHPYIIKKILETYNWELSNAFDEIEKLNQSDINNMNNDMEETNERKIEIINNLGGDGIIDEGSGHALLDFISGNDDDGNKNINNNNNNNNKSNNIILDDDNDDEF